MTNVRIAAVLVVAIVACPSIRAQTRSDSASVRRVSLAAFAKARPVYLDVHQSRRDDLLARGSRLDRTWLDSLVHDPLVAGICDTVSCSPRLPDEFTRLRLGLPEFTSRDTAQLFLVLTEGWGTRPCSGRGITGYHLLLVKQGTKWSLVGRRASEHADFLDSLCAYTGPDKP
jgi:hypothetical protein